MKNTIWNKGLPPTTDTREYLFRISLVVGQATSYRTVIGKRLNSTSRTLILDRRFDYDWGNRMTVLGYAEIPEFDLENDDES